MVIVESGVGAARVRAALWLTVWLTLQAAIATAAALDLFTFRDAAGRVLAFTVPDAGPIPATVDQAGATQAALDWARHYYHRDDLDVLAVEFEVRPTRFWRVTFLARERGQTIRLYAAVLPDGTAVELIIRLKT